MPNSGHSLLYGLHYRLPTACLLDHSTRECCASFSLSVCESGWPPATGVVDGAERCGDGADDEISLGICRSGLGTDLGLICKALPLGCAVAAVR